MNPMKTQACFVTAFVLSVLHALASPVPASAPPNPEYPHINPGPWYELAPDWPQKPAEVSWSGIPGVALDAEGNIWMYTRNAPSMQVYAPDGRYLFGWGEAPGAHHIKIDREGFVWTADVTRHVVEKHRRDGDVVLTLGVDGEAGADERHFFRPADMAFASNGDIFVADGYGNARIVHFDKEGTYIGEWGSLGTEDGQFSIPHAIVIDSRDRLYIADRNNARIQVYSTGGELLDSWKHLLVPWGLWITDKYEIWVCGSSPAVWAGPLLGCPPKDQLVMKFNADGRLLELHAFPKGQDEHEQPGELNWVHGIALDTQGNLYLGDINGKRLQKFLRRP